ncbi:unnamed protein product [Blepharisma stoltei]|uniref:C2H2-type domain-containing protein n=1 Tax=Blepharisma stoltei TaxID=1481888 RepID=A0AAU9IXG5_9CILI|nr:unnamed protein product [Blepharisma stoltei]
MSVFTLQLAQLNIQKINEKSTGPAAQHCLCEHCMKVFETPYALKAHLLNEFELNEESIAFFNVEEGLEENSEPSTTTDISDQKCHEAKLEEILLKCPSCDKICKGHKGLGQHIGKKHSRKRKNSTCKQCGKGFRQKYALKFHIRQVHEEATKVICDFCAKEIYNKYSLLKHISKKHNDARK